MAKYKLCRNCHQPKEGSRCRPCRRESQRRWRRTHRSALRRRARIRYKARASVREQARAREYRWREDNREKHLSRKREESRRRHDREREARRASDPAYRAKWEEKQRRLAQRAAEG